MEGKNVNYLFVRNTNLGLSSSREPMLGKRTEDSTSSGAEGSTKIAGSRSSSPLHVLIISL